MFYIFSHLLFCCRQPVTLAHPPQAAGSMQAFTSLSPKALSAVLHQTARPGPDSGARRDPGPNPDSGPGASRDSGPDSGPGPSRDPPHLEQLQTELRDLRDQFGRMKSQHKYGLLNVICVFLPAVFTAPLPNCTNLKINSFAPARKSNC